jgi:hypothetical protein
MTGIYNGKPKAYCTAPMLKAMRAMEGGAHVPSGTNPKVLDALLSRGWLNRNTGTLTPAGRQYLQEHPEK